MATEVRMLVSAHPDDDREYHHPIAAAMPSQNLARLAMWRAKVDRSVGRDPMLRTWWTERITEMALSHRRAVVDGEMVWVPW